MIEIADFIAGWPASVFGRQTLSPWDATSRAGHLVRAALPAPQEGYRIDSDVAIHISATVEAGATVKGPAIIGPNCFVAANAYLRGGIFLGDGCIIGPGCELKSTFMLRDSKVAHLSFVGDSLVGTGVNIEAGAIVANYRNEMTDKRIRILYRGATIDAGVDKFGALIGDNVRIGANAVIAPGAFLAPGTRIGRLARVDQHPTPLD